MHSDFGSQSLSISHPSQQTLTTFLLAIINEIQSPQWMNIFSFHFNRLLAATSWNIPDETCHPKRPPHALRSRLRPSQIPCSRVPPGLFGVFQRLRWGPLRLQLSGTGTKEPPRIRSFRTTLNLATNLRNWRVHQDCCPFSEHSRIAGHNATEASCRIQRLVSFCRWRGRCSRANQCQLNPELWIASRWTKCRRLCFPAMTRI